MVPGLRIGHAEDIDACTGCTVLLGPFRGAVDVRGLATGSRELHVLSPLHLVEQVDAVLLAGGSAYGLAAADGVVSWLEEHGHGFETQAARVPIVPAAVIYDLAVGRADRRPDAAMGRAACVAAVPDNTREGPVGVGCGATAGKIARGIAGAMRTGFATTTVQVQDYTVTAVAVVNALGDVLGQDGSIIAGAPAADGSFIDARALLASADSANAELAPSSNTTLVAAITDAPLSRVDLQRVAGMAATGVARRIAPVHTPFDGDVVFALSTAGSVSTIHPSALLAIGSTAASAVEQAIERAALSGGAQ
jgi:L-aminopeptidase/D-esterase-like protein